MVVGLAVSFDISKESPVAKFSDGLPECMVSRQGPDEGVAKPWGERCWGLVGAVIGLGVDAGNPGSVIWSTVVAESHHPSVHQLFNVFGGLKEALSCRDGEVRNLSPIFLVPLWWGIRGSEGIVDPCL